VSAVAAADFTAGRAGESTAELTARLAAGAALKVWSTPDTVQALVAAASPDRPADASLIGYGCPEMKRDRYWIFPVGGGGRADVYVRTADLPRRVGVRVTATLVEKEAAGGVWQASLDRDAAPGFYEVVEVRRVEGAAPDATGTELVADVRGYDASGADAPDLRDAEDAAFGRYQTATVRFRDERTATAALTENESTAEYELVVRAMPGVADLQDALGSGAGRPGAGDVHVRAAVPCDLSVTVTVERTAGTVVVDADGIAAAVAAAANAGAFPGRLYGGRLAAAAAALLPSGASVARVDMLGRIYRPDGAVRHVRAVDVLVVPDDPDRYVTADTVAFLLDPADVAVDVLDVG
jgi:hypothetical protein